MTGTAITEGVALASRLTIKAVQTELHKEEVEIFNADVTMQGVAWGQLEINTEELIDDAENLDFEQLQERLDSLAEWRLTYLQERLDFFKRRQDLLTAIHSEWQDIVKKSKGAFEAEEVATAARLRDAGAGPEDSLDWEKGATNKANREFKERLRSMTTVVVAHKAWRANESHCENVLSHNEGIDELELREDLRKFVASRVA